MASNDSYNQTVIRLANLEDSQRIAALCHQLGYPTSPAAVEQRLKNIQQNESHAVYVAELLDGLVIGWVHVYVCQLVLTDLQAEIGGLIVDRSDRGSGIGQCLIQYAQQWANEQGCRSVLVRSNIVRQEAHKFYEKIGYSNVKTSLVFHKGL